MCGCGACDLLDLHTGMYRRLPGVERTAANAYGNGETVRAPDAGSPGARLAFGTDGQLLMLTVDGEVMPVELP